MKIRHKSWPKHCWMENRNTESAECEAKEQIQKILEGEGE